MFICVCAYIFMMGVYFKYVLLLFSHSVMSDFLQPHGLQHAKASLSLTIYQSLLKLLSIELVMPSNHNVFCCPLLLLLSVFPSIRASSHQLAKDQSFSFSISSSNEYSGLISFRIDCFDLLAVQGTLKSVLQHHSSKASIWHSAFFLVQLLHQYMTTGKNHSFD